MLTKKYYQAKINFLDVGCRQGSPESDISNILKSKFTALKCTYNYKDMIASQVICLIQNQF